MVASKLFHIDESSCLYQFLAMKGEGKSSLDAIYPQDADGEAKLPQQFNHQKNCDNKNIYSDHAFDLIAIPL